MGIFRSDKKEDEYDIIYEHDIEDTIDELRGNIGRGDCVYCGAKNAMKYEGHICFICDSCGRSVHEDIYYRWAAGCDIEFED